MKIAFDITHPADIHQFRNCITQLENLGHPVQITARNSTNIKKLLQEFQYDFELRRSNHGAIQRIVYILPIVSELYLSLKTFKPDLIVGSSGNLYVPLVAKLFRIKAIIFDDTEHTRVQNMLTFPFADYICTPNCYKLQLGKKQIRYNGSKELAYLHPNYFHMNGQPLKQELHNLILDEQKLTINEQLTTGKRIILIRLVAWKASHDLAKKSLIHWEHVIKALKKNAIVIIVSENNDKNSVQSNVLIPATRFHDLISVADIVISEGATTAAESAVLGKPVFYCNKLKLGYIDEYDQKYGLIQQVYNQDNLIAKINELLTSHNFENIYRARRDWMLQNKIDVNQWMVRFLIDLEKEQHKKSIHLVGNFDPNRMRPGGIENYIKSIIQNSHDKISTIGVIEKDASIMKKSASVTTDKFQINETISSMHHLSVFKNKKPTFTTSSQFLTSLFLKASFLKIENGSILHFQRPDHSVPFLIRKNPKICSIHGNPAEVIRITRSRFSYHLYNILERISMPFFKKIGFIDHQTLELYKSKYPKHTDKFVVISPCVNYNFQPLEQDVISQLKKTYKVRNNESILLIVARLEKEKNLFEILKIFKSLDINRNSRKVRLLIAGVGSLLPELRKTIIKFGDENITLLGHINHDKLPDIYNIADVTFLYSYSEGFPLVALESLACGTPVVSNANGDLPRLIKNNYNGYIVDEHTVKHRLNYLLEFRPDWRMNCVASIENYKPEEFRKRLNDFYTINYFM